MTEKARDAESQRARLVAEAFDEKSREHLLKAGLSKGMDCLVAGPGTLALAVWMHELVGADGSVMLAGRESEPAGEALSIRFFLEDIMQMPTEEGFDLIHLRELLIHRKKAKELIKKLHGLLKPGGKLLIEEPDYTLAKWIDATDKEACKRVNSAICVMFESRGLKAYYGSIVHNALEEAGFKIEDNRSYLHLCSGNESMAKAMALRAKMIEEECLQTRMCSKEDIQKYISACEDEASLAVYYATVIIRSHKPV
jgi:SAM-dependent methyltransferase